MNGVNTMNEKEKEMLKNIAKALPLMSEMRKGEFVGYAQALVDLKTERQVEDILEEKPVKAS